VITQDAATPLRGIAASIADSTPMLANMVFKLADDIESRGPIARLIGDHPDDRAPLFGLRLLAGVRMLSLTGQARELTVHLDQFTSRFGDPAFDRRTWELLHEAFAANPETVLAALDRPIQQHRPSHGAALLKGLAMLSSAKVRLFELGSCAGLNLLIDRYRWFGEGWEWGDPDSSVRLATTGRFPGAIEIVDRAGCDLDPRDPGDPAEVMILRSFLPHERDIDRMEFDDAVALAARSGLRIEKADAVEWLTRKLSGPSPGKSVYTVVWHSMFWMHLSPQEKRAIQDVLSEAARRMPIAQISYEASACGSAPRLQVCVY
jgi:hypothetical protein